MRAIKRRRFLESGLAPFALAAGAKTGRADRGAGAAAQGEIATAGDDYSSRDPRIEVDLGAIAFNVGQIRKKTGGRPILAVLKCNAYGHGLVEVGRFLEKLPVHGLVAGKLSEAVALRRYGVRCPVLNLGPFGAADAAVIVGHGISQTVFTDDVEALSAAARAAGREATVHVKVDTGLGRVGVRHDAALAYLRKVARLPGIEIEGVFHSFNEEPAFDRVQHERFMAFTKAAAREGLPLGLRHAAASTAVFRYGDEFFLDAVRPGIAIYGHYPTEEEHKLMRMELRPALSLKATASIVKDLAPGESLSYFRKFVAEKPERVATIAMGYSDGLPLTMPSGGQALIRGRRLPFLCELTASHSYVRATGHPDIVTGDEVVIIGSQGGETIALWDQAQAVKVSDYKILIGLSPALKRVYRRP